MRKILNNKRIPVSRTIRQHKLPNATPENESQNTKHSIKWAAHLQRAQCVN